MPDQVKWDLTGQYFETCNCKLVCPCLVSAQAPLTSAPTEGDCHVAVLVHIDKGAYGGTGLDGLNGALVAKSNGAMGNGNITYALYIDERADARQAAGLEAIMGGTGGGPVAGFLPLFGKNLGVKKAKIEFRADGKTRSGKIAGILDMSVTGLASLTEGSEIWAETGHPFSPKKLALAVSGPGSTFTDHGWKWDNSGKNGHYAAIAWSG